MTVINALVQFGTSLVLARLCGPDTLGDFVLVSAWSSLAFAVLSPGFDQAYIHDPKLAGRWEATVVLTVFQLILLLSLPVAVWVLTDHQDTAGVFQCLMLATSMAVCGNLLLSSSAARLAYSVIHKARISAAILSSAASIATALLLPEPGMTPLVVRELASGGGLALAGAVMARLPRWGGWPHRSQVVEVVAFARALWALNTLEKSIQRVEYVLLGGALPAREVGVYYAIRSVFDGLYGVVATPIQTVFYAYLCRARDADGIRARRLSGGSALRLLLMSLVAAGAGALLAPIFTKLFGSAYATDRTLPAAFSMVLVMAVAFEWLKVSAMSSNLHGRLLWARILQIAVLIVGIPLLTQHWGSAGAAATATLAASAATLLAFRLVQERA